MSSSAQQLHPWLWIVFGILLLGLLVLDLFIHRGEGTESHRSAMLWSAIWVGAGLLFAPFIWATLGRGRAAEYLAAYLIEKSLSLDNLFVFLTIFQGLGVPRSEQRRVLSWGIFGALFFRAVFIMAGVAAIERYDWMVYVFATILALTAVRLAREDPRKEQESRLLHALSNHLPVSAQVHGSRFFAVENGRRVVTPLFVALLVVEVSDIGFAIDSVPAALSVTRDTFVVYTSNAFAILGLRSLYFVLQGALQRLQYLHYGLAAVLAFAALKLVASHWIEVPPLISIAVITAALAASAWPDLGGRAAFALSRRFQR